MAKTFYLYAFGERDRDLSNTPTVPTYIREHILSWGDETVMCDDFMTQILTAGKILYFMRMCWLTMEPLADEVQKYEWAAPRVLVYGDDIGYVWRSACGMCNLFAAPKAVKGASSDNLIAVMTLDKEKCPETKDVLRELGTLEKLAA